MFEFLVDLIRKGIRRVTEWLVRSVGCEEMEEVATEQGWSTERLVGAICEVIVRVISGWLGLDRGRKREPATERWTGLVVPTVDLATV